MKIVIRADASPAIGTGHIMRCLTLADTLRDAGTEVSFVCRKSTGGLGDVIVGAGHAVRYLPEKIHDWQADAEATCSILAQAGPVDGVIVDHYALDARWETHLRRHVRAIMAIDDLADRQHDCDLLLDQNYHPNAASRYDGLLPKSCRTLFGPQFSMLRKGFADMRRNLRERDGTVRRMLVFFGGSDPTTETRKAMQALDLLDRPDWHVDVVVGASNPHRQDVEQWCLERPNVSYHCQVSNFAVLMMEADLALGAGGSTTWERCCLGLPAIVIAVALNQIDVARAAAGAGCIHFLGASAEVSAESMAESVRRLVENQSDLRAMAMRGMALVDGYGAERVGAALRRILGEDGNLPCPTLRRAEMNDERSLYEWRNAPEVRTASFDDRVIPWEDHVRWFHAVLGNPDRHLLIGEIDGRPIGVLRYDRRGSETDVSIYLVPGVAGKGLGVRLLLAGHRWVEGHLPNIRRIVARILPDNPASQKAFARAGYVPNGSIHVFDLESGG